MRHLHRSPSATARFLSIALALCGLVASAFAEPIMRISWDDCSPVVVNKNWAGPGPYVHVVSATGLTTGMRFFFLGVRTDQTRTPAWSFSDFTSAPLCHPFSAVTVSTTGTSCTPLPAVALQYEVSHALNDPEHTGYTVGALLTAGTPLNPELRYTIAKLVFDHALSVAGPHVPGSGTCGDADLPVCFAASAYVGDDTNPFSPIAMDGDHLTWQGFSDCPNAVPAQASTWGEIKAQYR